MIKTSSIKVSRSRWLWNKIRHGLILHGLSNRLARVGLVIKPYFWVQEGIGEFKQPEIKGNISEYSVQFLGPTEIKIICAGGHGFNEKIMLEGYHKGQKWIGLKHNDEIAAFMSIEYDEFEYKHKVFKLNKDEVYLFNMLTLEQYRGKNLAPYLRYKSYEFVKKKGIKAIYSISQCFNHATIKFKKKLNSKHLKLYLYISLFNKFHWHILLRNYKS